MLSNIEAIAKRKGFANIVLYNSMRYVAAGGKRSAEGFYERNAYHVVRLNSETIYCWKMLD
jgi:hypothetical protein